MCNDSIQAAVWCLCNVSDLARFKEKIRPKTFDIVVVAFKWNFIKGIQAIEAQLWNVNVKKPALLIGHLKAGLSHMM